MDERNQPFEGCLVALCPLQEQTGRRCRIVADAVILTRGLTRSRALTRRGDVVQDHGNMDVIPSAITLLLPLVFIVAMIALVVRRGFQLKLLVEDGLETTGTVVRKVKFRGSRSSRSYRLKYQYIDELGRSHEHRSMVTKSFYRRYEEGSPIAVVYSRSKPHISAPKELVEQTRAGMAKRPASSGS